MKQKILLVEDEEDTANLLKSVLEREGFSVIQARDGRQATTLIETTRPTALVLLDLVLPYVSGPELLKTIRQHPDWKPTPVIIVSADSYGPDIQRVLEAGATAYVLKHKGSKGLLEEVKRVLPSAPVPDDAVATFAMTSLPKRPKSERRHVRGSQRKKRVV